MQLSPVCQDKIGIRSHPFQQCSVGVAMPEMAPGTIPEIQLVVVCQAPVLAVKLHVPLAASAGDITAAVVNQIKQAIHGGPSTIRRPLETGRTTAARLGVSMRPSLP